MTYRGYDLYVMEGDEVRIYHRGDHIDTSDSLTQAKSTIDGWMGAP